MPVKSESMTADGGIEERFVKTFIRKSRRERLLYELNTPGKRSRGLDRFCHRAEDLLDPAKTVLRDERLEYREDFRRFAAKRPKNELCRILSPDPDLDGLLLPLSDAVDAVSAGCDAAVIIGPEEAFAVVYGEAMKGGRGKFFLTKDGLPRF
ncbi:MAG: hypothetical protein E7576_10450 [Ruminococcaceae bacterium]|nr:hypothetical protein [Oscillospiraceae bacterium]